MLKKIITDVATEPISLTQLKNHLRLDSSTFLGDITTHQSILPGSHVIAANYSLIGTGIEVLGKRTIVNLNSGTNGGGGTVNVKIQESDDNITYTDWLTGVFTQVTTANDNAIQEKEYTGSKRYVRVVSTIAGASCEFGVDIITDSAYSTEDDWLNIIITLVRQYGEDYTKHAFAPQTIDVYYDYFPSKDYIEWTKGPLTSITGVYYTDSAGTETTMTVTTQYLVDVNTFPGKIFLPYGVTWPSYVEYPYNSVRVRGVCGYTGTVPYVLPKTYYQAMLLHAGLLYSYRESDRIPEKSMNAVHSLYNMRKVWKV